jgi:hypothetical protein
MGSRNQKKDAKTQVTTRYVNGQEKTEKMPGHVSAHQYTRLVLDCAVWHGCVVPRELYMRSPLGVCSRPSSTSSG